MVLASCRKFCPRVFVGRRSSCWARSRMAAGPSSPSVCSGVLRGIRSVEQAGSAVRPLSRTGPVVELLRPEGLLVRRGLRGQAGAADGPPGGLRELVQAVVLARGADRVRTPTGLAGGQGGPVEPVGGRLVGRTLLGTDDDVLVDRLAGHRGAERLAAGLPAVDDGHPVRRLLLAV